MQAIVLVGGFGTRLRPLTNTIPKQLLDVAGVPMIERVVRSLAPHGVTTAVLSMGYLPEPFVDAYPTRDVAGVRLEFAVEPEPLDTAGAILFAARQFGIASTFLAVNGDVLTDLDVSALIAQHRATGAEGTVHLTPVEDPRRFGVVVTGADGRVTEWVEKPEGPPPGNHVNAGTYVLEPSVLGRIPEGVVSIERAIFPVMVAEGRLFGRLDYNYWLDAGTPAAYLRANLDVLDGVRACDVPGERRGDVLLLEGAYAAPDARVSRSVLGRGVRVEAGARVESSVLLDGARVSADAVVVESVLGPSAIVGEGATLHDGCLVAEGEHVPAGASRKGDGVDR